MNFYINVFKCLRQFSMVFKECFATSLTVSTQCKDLKKVWVVMSNKQFIINMHISLV